MFWAATRNIVRSRGLVSFRDHFCVPAASQLAKYQKQIVEICGLKNDSVGRPGIQSKTAELWVNSKSIEAGSQPLCTSVSMDAKKISVTDSGLEDLAGLGNSRTNEQETEMFKTEMAQMEALIQQDDRQGIYTVFDSITLRSQQLTTRIVAIEELLRKNNKLLNKNPLLSKYIYVLNNQLASGKKIMNGVKDVQSQVISVMAEKRNCKDLIPVNGTVHLDSQENFHPLSNLSNVEEEKNLGLIVLGNTNGILEIAWPSLLLELTRKSDQFGRNTQTFTQLLSVCYLSTEQLHTSCGLGNSTPLLDMKNAWSRAHSVYNTSNIPVPVQSSPTLIATFCSSIAVMLFGKNCTVSESGIHIRNGICATPDLIVQNSDGKVDYTVRIVECPNNIFQLTRDVLVTSLADSYICGSEKGSIAILHSDQTCVAVHIPTDHTLVQRMLVLVDSYIKLERCIGRRNSAMLTGIKEIQKILLAVMGKVTILGCYPVVETVSNIGQIERTHFKASISISSLRSFMNETRSFLSKKAKELVALNISDLSGNTSKTPHTILGATYLTSASLKLVGRQCLDEVCEMLDSNGAKVLNIGVDGESLHLASILPNGSPGTLQTLIKHLHDKLRAVKKERLVELVVVNPEIDLSEDFAVVDDDDDDRIDDLEIYSENEDQITEDLLDSAALIENGMDELNNYTNEDVENMLVSNSHQVNLKTKNLRKNAVKELNLAQLRMLCLKHIIPKAKQIWLLTSLGMDSFHIHLDDGEVLKYTPNTVFEQIENKFFRTISFDYAHIINLFREHAAKGRLFKLGLDVKNLQLLSEKSGYEYLKRIIQIKGNKLMFDSMNQKAAESLFSHKTVQGLEAIGDKNGAHCARVISDGLGALDQNGIDVQSRIERIVIFKTFLENKNNMIERLKRADKQNMTNELLTMVLTTLDSYIYTTMNMQFFNVRRKGRLRIQIFKIIS